MHTGRRDALLQAGDEGGLGACLGGGGSVVAGAVDHALLGVDNNGQVFEGEIECLGGVEAVEGEDVGGGDSDEPELRQGESQCLGGGDGQSQAGETAGPNGKVKLVEIAGQRVVSAEELFDGGQELAGVPKLDVKRLFSQEAGPLGQGNAGPGSGRFNGEDGRFGFHTWGMITGLGAADNNGRQGLEQARQAPRNKCAETMSVGGSLCFEAAGQGPRLAEHEVKHGSILELHRAVGYGSLWRDIPGRWRSGLAGASGRGCKAI